MDCVLIVPAGGQAVVGARASAGTVMTQFSYRKFTGHVFQWLGSPFYIWKIWRACILPTMIRLQAAAVDTKMLVVYISQFWSFKRSGTDHQKRASASLAMWQVVSLCKGPVLWSYEYLNKQSSCHWFDRPAHVTCDVTLNGIFAFSVCWFNAVLRNAINVRHDDNVYQCLGGCPHMGIETSHYHGKCHWGKWCDCVVKYISVWCNSVHI